MPLETAYLRVVEGRGPAAAAVRTALLAGVPLYRLGAAVDARRKLARRRALGRPAVSVGNLSVGGTGKTPAVGWLAGRLRAAGHRPAVLTRGHGGRPGADADEVLVLREALGPGVPVTPDPDRHAGAAATLRAHPPVSCFVLDDAFQRRDVARELDLVLVDASRGLRAARVLPAGLLREPPGALARADAVLLTRVERAGPERAAEVAAWVRRHHGRDPLARFAHRWSGVRVHTPGEPTPAERPVAALRGRRVYAAAGVGHPGAFADQLRAAGAEVLGEAGLGDHHRPDAAGLARLHAAAAAAGAAALVTTQKDRVKWRSLDPGPAALPVWVPRLSFEAVDGEAALVSLLLERVGSA